MEDFPPECPVFSVRDGVFSFTEGRLFVGEGPSVERPGLLRVQPIESIVADDASAFVFSPQWMIPHTPAASEMLAQF